MKVTLTSAAGPIAVEQPVGGALYVQTVDATCPGCGAKPMHVRGGRPSIEGHDTYQAAAMCADCRAPVGVLRVHVSTIFGIEEDRRVLSHGRCRVYTGAEQ